jgi:hypothetical protein
MERISIGALILFVGLLVGIAVELARPHVAVQCAECGDGPRDRKCPDGFRCVEGRCVKR